MQSYPSPPPDQTPPGGGSVPPPAMGQTPLPGNSPSLPGYDQWGRSDPYATTAGSSGIVPASPLTPPPPPGPGQTFWPTVPTAGGPLVQVPPSPSQAPRRSLTWLWIIALVVVFLAGLGLGDVIGTLTAAPKTTSTANRSTPSTTSTALSSTDATATAAAAASSSSTTAESSPTATPTSSSSSSTTSSSSSVHHKVGETVTFNNVWQITVNSVQTSPGQGFDQPQGR
ncbi:hypothetical protein [Thermogemmatispora carboxidivorans]|uniref:hypothetical protein n=1 Tax=Thermogemmatispora carboxidivorans TaxID=1382306 RepID=UPI00069B5D71|nr:hypothetical protein [Thermogemmatispora carboxidivorans]